MADLECGARDDANACDGGHAGCSYSGVKSEPFYSAELKFQDFQAGGERMKEKAEAEKLVAECCQAGSAIITKVEQKEKIREAPGLV